MAFTFCVLPALISVSHGVACGASRYPEVLLNWLVEGTFYALIVEKAKQRLTVWSIQDGEPVPIESYRCSSGENRGDKWVRGDMKTPEGVYFFCSVIDGRNLPPKYGYWAFTTDYPNFIDRRRGKNGDGIWLHGRDKPVGRRPDSNGCIAMNNEDLAKVSRYIRLQGTPIIIVDKLRMVDRARILEEERELRDFIESWRQAWESQDLERYMSHYSPNFQSCWLDFRQWREKKARLIARYHKIRVKLGKIYLYKKDDIVTAIFTQRYRSDGYEATGIKLLYLIDGEGYRIYSEDYHKLVDDPFPVAPLLARAGVEPLPDAEERAEFQIRLVSTDEPDSVPDPNPEKPRPSAPSRGIAVAKIAPAQDERPVGPELVTNSRVDGAASMKGTVALAAKLVPATIKLHDKAIAFNERRRLAVASAAGPSFPAEPATRGTRSASEPLRAEADRVAEAATDHEKQRSTGEAGVKANADRASQSAVLSKNSTQRVAAHDADDDKGGRSRESGKGGDASHPGTSEEREESTKVVAALQPAHAGTEQDAEKSHDSPARELNYTSVKSISKSSVSEFLKRWKAVWEEKDLDSFLKMYHANCRVSGLAMEEFQKSKRRYFGRYDTIRVQIAKLKIKKARDRFLVKFLQSFQGDKYRDKGWKHLVLVAGKERKLQILREKWTPQ